MTEQENQQKKGEQWNVACPPDVFRALESLQYAEGADKTQLGYASLAALHFVDPTVRRQLLNMARLVYDKKATWADIAHWLTQAAGRRKQAIDDLLEKAVSREADSTSPRHAKRKSVTGG